MKKYITIISVAAAAVALSAAASCQKEQTQDNRKPDEEIPAGLVKSTFTATQEAAKKVAEEGAEATAAAQSGATQLCTVQSGAAQSGATQLCAAQSGAAVKTVLDPQSGAVSWAEGDKLVFAWEIDGAASSAASDAVSDIDAETGKAKIVANIPDGFSDGDFSGEGRSLYAVYPSSVSAETASSKLSITVPGVQDGTFAGTNISAAECVTGSSELALKNIGGLLQFTIEDASVRKVIFDAGETSVAGKAEVTFNEGVPTANVTAGVSTVTLNVSGAGTYYISVLPCTLNGFSVELQNGGGDVIGSQSTKNTLTVERNAVKKLGTVELGFDDKFFVTPEGKGAKSGRSWDNAADVAGLKTLAAKDIEAEVYLASGTYSVTSPFESNTASTAKFTVYGGYPSDATGFSTENRDATANATIFDGGSASRIWVMNQGTFSIDGVTFQNANSQKSANGGAFGIASSGDETVFVTFTSCKFLKNSTAEYGTGTSNSGGAINIGKKSKVDIYDCDFEGNYGRNGGAINQEDATSVLNVKNSTFCQNFTYNTSGSVQCANGTQTFESCTFDGNYTRIGTGGAAHMGGTATVTFKNCTFKECEGAREQYSYTTTSNQYIGGAISIEKNACLDIEGCTFDGNMASAGSAIYAIKNNNAVIKVSGSVFKNNKCGSRGVIMLNGGNAVLFLNNCSFFDNTMRTNEWGVVLHGGSPSTVCMNNCTFYNNTSQTTGGNSGCLNHDGWFIGTNCTVIGNNALATYRINSKKVTQGYWYNSILANEYENGLALNENAMSSAINTFNCVIGPKMSSKDDLWVDSGSTVDTDILSATSFDSSKMVWLWNGPGDSFTKTTEDAIRTALTKMTDNNGNTTLNSAFGPKFAEWVESLGGFDNDQLGNARTASGTWPGSIESK